MTRAARLALAALAMMACSSKAPPPEPSPPPARPAPAATQAPAPARGRVETRSFASAALGVDKDYLVYVPAGYDERPTTRWPVFYYLHGLTGNETNWVEYGKLAEAADALGLGAIVVMPDGDDGFYADAIAPIDYDACMRDGTGLFMPAVQPRRKTCVRARKYGTYIVDDLIAHVDRTYRTIPTREGRAIAGLSMGGFGALQLAMRHPDRFAAAASHSGVDALLYAGPFPYVAGKVELLADPKAWGTGAGEIGRWVRGIFGTELARWRAHDPAALVAKLEPGRPAIYLDCGTEDVFLLHNGMQYLHDLLLARGIEHAYFLGPGKHDFTFWAARLPASLAYLRDHTTRPVERPAP